MIGKNLSIDNSFTLKFVNNTSTAFTFNLFNQGGIGSVTTPLTNGILSSVNNMNVPTLVNGVFSAATIMEVYDSTFALISTIVMPLGTTINNYLAAINPLTDTLGNVGTLFGQQTPNSISTTSYDWSLTGFAADLFKFAGNSVAPSVQRTTFVTTNPFLLIQGVVPITVIQQSETGNAYRIMGMDIISNKSEQLLQDIVYGNRESNGNIWSASFTPTIDPYQNNAISIHGVSNQATGRPMDDFTINTDTTFSYTVIEDCFSRLTFNYVKASVASLREFHQAFASELSMRFLKQKKYLDSLKGGTIFLQ